MEILITIGVLLLCVVAFIACSPEAKMRIAAKLIASAKAQQEARVIRKDHHKNELERLLPARKIDAAPSIPQRATVSDVPSPAGVVSPASPAIFTSVLQTAYKLAIAFLALGIAWIVTSMASLATN